MRRSSVAVISPRVETRSKLSGILTQGQWTVFQATGVEEAVALLRTNRIPVVIVEGSWRPILERLSEFPERPSIVVTALFADEALWAEVLNIGGYDVMAQPFDRDEVLRITESAMRSASRDSLAPQTLAISASAAC